MDFRSIIMGVAFAVMWASAFTSARFIVMDAPPLTALSLRFLGSGVLAVGIAAALGQTWRMSWPQARATVVFGVLQNGLYLGLNFIAMQTVEASVAVIIAATMPLIVALLGWAFFREALRPLGWLGLFLGLAGVMLIMGNRMQGAPSDWVAVGYCVIGAISLAVATLFVRDAMAGGNVLMVVGLQMLIASVVLSVPAVLLETWAVNWTWSLVLSFGYTLLFPGLIATFVWFLLVDRIGTVRAAVFHFLTPFLGVAVAALLLGEPFGWVDVAGVLIITLGIWAVQRAKASLP